MTSGLSMAVFEVSVDHSRDQMSRHLALEARSSGVGSVLELNQESLIPSRGQSHEDKQRRSPDTFIILIWS